MTRRLEPDLNLRTGGYDPREASRVYAMAAAMLSGFSLAAIVLLAASDSPEIEATVRDRALLALVVTFIGCGLSAFVADVAGGGRIEMPDVCRRAAGVVYHLFFFPAVVVPQICELWPRISLHERRALLRECGALLVACTSFAVACTRSDLVLSVMAFSTVVLAGRTLRDRIDKLHDETQGK